jgi:hypothetical protein
MALLRPLLLDNVPSIQQSAALALGRLANYSDELAEAVVSNEILPQLVYSLSEQNVSYRFQYFKFFNFLKLETYHFCVEILQEGRRLRS